MAGNNHLIVQPRDRNFLRELAILRVVDHEQARIVAGFGSTSRANKRLLKLVRAGLLRRFFLGSGGGRKALYSLSEKGALTADVPFRGLRRKQGAVVAMDFFVEHQLAVNEIYRAARFGKSPSPEIRFVHWMGFHAPLAPELRLIPDGYVELTTPAGIAAFSSKSILGRRAKKSGGRRRGSIYSLPCRAPSGGPSGTTGSGCSSLQALRGGSSRFGRMSRALPRKSSGLPRLTTPGPSSLGPFG
jgi:hypothetical protein